MRNATDHYDLIVLDLTDAGGPSAELYTPDFYRACAARLTPTGALTLHVAGPIAHPERVRATIAQLRKALPVVTPYLATIPLYGGLWMMACCSHTLDPRQLTTLQVDRRIAQRGLKDLQYYNGDTHRAAMALPNFVRALVPDEFTTADDVVVEARQGDREIDITRAEIEGAEDIGEGLFRLRSGSLVRFLSTAVVH